MKYDFDQIIDRSQNHSAKYDERVKKFGTDDVIPLWIADMDFKTAQPIIDALARRAQEGIWGSAVFSPCHRHRTRAGRMGSPRRSRMADSFSAAPATGP